MMKISKFPIYLRLIEMGISLLDVSCFVSGNHRYAMLIGDLQQLGDHLLALIRSDR